VTTTFADRWGAPVRAADGAAAGLLDQAVEDLVALSGDPGWERPGPVVTG
jgi:hypothetical protein